MPSSAPAAAAAAQCVVLLLQIWLPLCSCAGATELKFSVTEEQPASSKIGNVISSSSSLTQQWNESVRRQISFNVIHVDPQVLLGHFGLQRGGNLTVTRPVDREAVCANEELCKATVRVAVEPLDFAQLLLIHIQIDDLNDNSPSFDGKDKFLLNISEASSVSSSFSLPAAVDLDSPANSVSAYSLHGDSSNTFRVQQPAAPGGRPSLQLLRAIDREKLSGYSLILRAVDGGRPTRTGSISVEVNVVDENDERPRLMSGCGDVHREESARVGSEITTLVARDLDAGENGRLRFILRSAISNAKKDVSSTFRLGEADGRLTLAKPLDFEEYASITLQLAVIDGGARPLSAECTMTVTVQDVNDNAPSVSFSGTQAGQSLMVTEEQTPGKPFGYLFPSDADSGLSGQVSCSSASPLFNVRKVGSGSQVSYQLLTAAKYDRERTPLQRLTVRCVDSGEPQRTTIAHANVTVADINDNDPKFSSQNSDLSLDEGRPAGQFVAALPASDADAGANGRVTYRLFGSSASFFRVLANGSVVSAKALDREERDKHEFFVVATDGGNPPKSATATVSLSLTDINDCAPKFGSSSLEFRVKEDASVNEVIGQLRATDADLGDAGRVDFVAVTDANDAARSFHVSRSGRLTLRRALNREEQDRFFLRIVATDRGTPQMNSTATVTILVDDVNDNQPLVHWPTLMNHTKTVSYRTPPNAGVCIIDATDADVGDNGRLSFTLRDIGGAGLFDVGAVDGQVFVRRALSRSDVGRYEVEIVVSDHGSPRLQSVARLLLLVDDSSPATAAGLSASELNFLLIIVICSVTFVVSCILVASIWHTRRRLSPNHHNRLYATTKCCSKTEEQELGEAKLPMETAQTRVELPLEAMDGRLKVSHASLYSRNDYILPMHHCHLHDCDTVAGANSTSGAASTPRNLLRAGVGIGACGVVVGGGVGAGIGEGSAQSSESDSGRGTCFIDDDPFREQHAFHPQHQQQQQQLHHHQSNHHNHDYRTLTINPSSRNNNGNNSYGVSTFTLDSRSRDLGAAAAAVGSNGSSNNKSNSSSGSSSSSSGSSSGKTVTSSGGQNQHQAKLVIRNGSIDLLSGCYQQQQQQQQQQRSDSRLV